MLGGLQHFALLLVLIARMIGKYGNVECYSKSPSQFQVPTNPKSIYFTGAGVFFFWQVGAAKYLKETCVLKSDMPILGASAGSLTGLLLLAGVDFDKATEIALAQSAASGVYNKPTGLAGELGPLLQQWLQTVIPEDMAMETLGNLNVAITPASVVAGGVKAPKLVTNFTSKADVIEAVMASCHVPVFLDGRPTTEYRGESCIDGSFWYFVTKNRESGLPLPAGNPADIYWVDYTDDEDFMNSIEGTNFLSIVTEQGVREMVQAGYNHLKREHFYGRLPMARLQRPNFVLSTALRRARGLTPNLNNLNLTTPYLNVERAQTFASESLKWFLTAASVDGIASSITNVGIFSLATSALLVPSGLAS